MTAARRPPRRRWWGLLLALPAASLLWAGCGQQGTSAGDGPASSSPPLSSSSSPHDSHTGSDTADAGASPTADVADAASPPDAADDAPRDAATDAPDAASTTSAQDDQKYIQRCCSILAGMAKKAPPPQRPRYQTAVGACRMVAGDGSPRGALSHVRAALGGVQIPSECR